MGRFVVGQRVAVHKPGYPAHVDYIQRVLFSNLGYITKQRRLRCTDDDLGEFVEDEELWVRPYNTIIEDSLDWLQFTVTCPLCKKTEGFYYRLHPVRSQLVTIDIVTECGAAYTTTVDGMHASQYGGWGSWGINLLVKMAINNWKDEQRTQQDTAHELLAAAALGEIVEDRTEESSA